ncbi:hypothetical protein MKX07_005366 [Trichoderma sp. CBMAI-0711]|nr:hypothetical protein MKX07_005366 [Trichoderma sp. CBMAI-0711]
MSQPPPLAFTLLSDATCGASRIALALVLDSDLNQAAQPTTDTALPRLLLAGAVREIFKLLHTPLDAELRLRPGQIRSPVVASRPSVTSLDLPSRVGAVEDVLRSPVPTSKQFCHDELPGVVTPKASSLVTDGVSFECVSSLASIQWSSTRHAV